jgi:hypothetical protein
MVVIGLLVVVVITYLFAGVAYSRGLDLYVYFGEVESGNFLNQKWSLDLGFSAFIYLLSPLIFRPEALSVISILLVFYISMRLFEGHDNVIKATLFCLSYPVLIGVTNQLRATLFMALFLYALNSNKIFRFVKLLLASSVHVYSMILFLPVALRRTPFFWIIFIPLLIIVLTYKNFYLFTIDFFDVWNSYKEVDVDLLVILVKVFICVAYIKWTRDRFDVFIIILVAACLAVLQMVAVLDRFLTLAMMFLFFNFLKNLKFDSMRICSYLIFSFINMFVILNSSLLWAL